MLALVTVRHQLQSFVSYVNDNFSARYSIFECDGRIIISTYTSFVTSCEFGCLPSRLIAYCNIDASSGNVRLMFEKSDFRS